MAAIEDFQAWVARDLNYKTTDICDHVEIVGEDANTNDHGSERGMVIRIYTANNQYHVRAQARRDNDGNETGGYLGCGASSRTPRAGEPHTRGRDLPDGELSEETWHKILAAIVSYEMVKVHDNGLGQNDWGNRPPQGEMIGRAGELSKGDQATPDAAEETPRRPKVGSIVIFYCNENPGADKKKPRHPNNHRDHPAIVTTVFTERCVNLKVFFDCGEVVDITSQNLRETPDETYNPNQYWEWPE